MSEQLKTAEIVEILPTRIWIENDIMGSRHVMVQHEGMHAFTYASFFYDYAYTSNQGTMQAAEALAVTLGATKPVEVRFRDLSAPGADEGGTHG